MGKIYAYWYIDKTTGCYMKGYTTGQKNKKEVLTQYSGNGQKGWSLRNVYVVKIGSFEYFKALQHVKAYVL